MDSNKIRQTFLEFFRDRGHQIVPSAPMVVKNDPTLMFTNAGMNQFKDYFLGNSVPPSGRVADSQKCLRVSGKHNDLEEVGRDTYHHTMFEMLGNWSFGDYFKKEAIEWAWELLTKVFGLPPERMYATVFEGSPQEGVGRDEEAWAQWHRFMDGSHILDGSRKDNFWEMGESGPCGPCSEIHFDLRSDQERRSVDARELINKDHPHVIEIWNLVFIQYNRKADGTLEPLPQKHVDTGMGFERLCMVLQGKQSNYDTDVFQPLIMRLAALSGKRYGELQQTDIAMRVIADHVRAISFSIADGQLPSNVKAGYVIRRILRRAVRYGYTYLGFTEPFMYKLVEVLCGQMGAQYPELAAQRELIEKVIREEEASFLNTLATGISLLDNIMAKSKSAGGNIIGGRDAFLLYDTYGFPIDLTQLIASENSMQVDLEEFQRELTVQKERSRNAAAVDKGDWVELVPSVESRFVGYDADNAEVRIARYRKTETKGKVLYQVVLDVTPFYGNSGGQIGDTGYLEAGTKKYFVTDTQKENNLTVHIMPELPGNPEEPMLAVVDSRRREAIAANHTATHLVHEALREVLGSHVEQKGSLVTPDSLRFDFSHFQKVTDQEIRKVEELVNMRIRRDIPCNEQRDCDMDTARDMGAMMLFGEKYSSSVRVVSFGSSVELCGGIHATSTGRLGLFKITSESAISAGVRRIEAITGEKAEMMVYEMVDTLREIQRFINNPSVISGIKKMLEENEGLKDKLEEYKNEKKEQAAARLERELADVDGLKYFARRLDMPTDIIKDIAFSLRGKHPNLVFVLGSLTEGKAVLNVMLGDEVVARGVNAAEVIRTAAKEIQGGGGGQPFFATAGGKNPEGIERAIIAAENMIKEKLNS